MGLREQSIVGASSSCVFQFSVAQVLVGLRKQFIRNFVSPTTDNNNRCASDVHNVSSDVYKGEILMCTKVCFCCVQRYASVVYKCILLLCTKVCCTKVCF